MRAYRAYDDSRLAAVVIAIASAIIALVYAQTVVAEVASGQSVNDTAASSLEIIGSLKEAFDGQLMPGDHTAAMVAVTNKGDRPLRYAVTSKTTDDLLASKLQLTVSATDGGDCVAGQATAPAYGPGPLGNTNGMAVFSERMLAAGASESLCFSLSAPLSMDNTSQGMSTQPTFDFIVEQMGAAR